MFLGVARRLELSPCNTILFLHLNDAEDQLEQSSHSKQRKYVVPGVLQSVEMAAVRNTSETGKPAAEKNRYDGASATAGATLQLRSVCPNVL